MAAVVQAQPGPAGAGSLRLPLASERNGVNGAWASPRYPGSPGLPHRGSPVRGESPTKAGTSGCTGPFRCETTDPKLGRPPCALLIMSL